MKHWLIPLATAGLVGAATIDDFDWTTITPSKKLEYHPCYDDFECARLIVPLDWLDESNPNTVAIAIAKLPAKVPDDDPSFAGPIFTNPGGPGGSGVAFLLREAHILQDIADTDASKYEILSWDPRGVQFTTPRADCYGDLLTRGVDAIQRLAIGPASASPDALRRQWARMRGYAKLCSRTASANESILPYATTASVVRDIVEMLDKIQELRDHEAAGRVGPVDAPQKTLQARARGGEENVPRLKYWGFSYGSLLGNTFASMYPGRVGRVIIDGIVDADDYTAGLWSTNLQDTEELVEYFYKTCFAAGSNCALNRPSDKKWQDVRQRVLDLTDRLDHDPISTLDDKLTNILTGHDVVHSFIDPLYSAKRFVALAETLNQAVEGNYTSLLESARSSIPPLEKACSSRNDTSHPAKGAFDEGGQSILCGDADDATNRTLADYSAYVAQLVGQSPTFAGMWANIRVACTGWEVRPKWRFTGPYETPEHDPALVEGRPAAPLLFLSSRLDPVTPLRNAYKMSETHPGSVVVVQESVGHCASVTGSRCTKKIIQEYLERGVLPEEGTVCEPDCDVWDLDNCGAATKDVEVAALGALGAPGEISLGMRWV